MTDYEIAIRVEAIVENNTREQLRDCSIIINKDFGMSLMPKKKVNKYLLKKYKAIEVDVPKLSDSQQIAIAQIALAVGRRLERFERGRKANAGRTAESRQKIAQSAIQARWNAKQN